MTLDEYLAGYFFNNGDNYIRIHIGLLNYWNRDYQLVSYYTYLVSLHHYWREKKSIENPWFYLGKKQMEIRLGEGIANKDVRKRLDKKLEEKKLIKTKLINKVPRRKFYKINIEQMKRLSEELHKNWKSNLASIANDSTSIANDNRQKIYTNNEYNKLYSYSKDASLLLEDDNFGNNSEENNNSKIYLKNRRPNDPATKIINLWNSKGFPFAKVRNIYNARKSIKKVLNKKKNKLSFHLVAESIDRAYPIMSSEDFLFMTSQSMSLTQFFKPYRFMAVSKNPYFKVNNRIYETLNKALPGKEKTWLNLFLLKSDEMLERYLLDKIYLQPGEHICYEILKEIIPLGTFSHRKDKSIRISSAKMLKYAMINNVPVNTIKTDLINYYQKNKNKFRYYWLSSNDFWNNEFSKYLSKVGRFDRKAINKI